MKTNIFDKAADLYLEGTPINGIGESIKSRYGITMGKNTLYRNLKKRIKLRSISETLKLQNRKGLHIDEMIRLYVKDKYSIKELAEKFSRNWYTIRKILIENNIKLKDWGEINHLFRSKFAKPKVDISKIERAYLTGLVVGDFAVYKKSKYTIRITTGSTIQEFINMIRGLFEKYGHVMQSHDKFNDSEKITIDLDSESFEFLFDAKKSNKFLDAATKEEFFQFLAGFIDAEGSVSINKRKLRNRIEFGIQIYNTNLKLLKIIASKLEEHGFHPHITKTKDKGNSYYKGKIFNHNYIEYRVGLTRNSEIKALLELVPIKHPNKIVKSRLILYLLRNKITKLTDFLRIVNQPFTLPTAKNFVTGLEIPDKLADSTTSSKSL